MALTDGIYRHAPVWLQNLGMTAYGWVWARRRFGPGFDAALEGFVSRRSFSAEEWRVYQEREVGRLLGHAADHVPFYRRRWAEAGVDSGALADTDLDALARLPLLEREALRSDIGAFTSDTAPRKLHVYHTSGTTGTPVPIRFSDSMHRRWSAAYEARCRRFAGVDRTMSRVMIGGRLVVPRGASRPPFWRYNRYERQMYMSAFHIGPDTARTYVEAIADFRPDYLVGYASAHFFLARFIVELGLTTPGPRAVLTSSEKLTGDMRATIETAWGCPVFDAYSGVEACCLASECREHRMHVSPDVGLVELLDEAGEPVGPGQVGEIVATGLLNFDQPLIRYRTGDLAAWAENGCPCGFDTPVLEKLEGRLEDTVVGPDGRETVRFHGLFVGLSAVREAQVVQEALTRFTVRVAVDEGFGETERRVIRGRFAERLGRVDVDFEYVPRIERTAAGKVRAVVSKVSRAPDAAPPA